MHIGLVGLGKMGGNMAARLLAGGHEVVVNDHNQDSVSRVVSLGATAASSLQDLVNRLAPPRAIWCMLPAGEITESVIAQLGEILECGDVVIDGGNTYFKDDVRRAQTLSQRGIRYVDVGTSGGVWGVERGYCLMVGADPEVFALLEPALATLAPGHDAAPRTPGRSAELTVAEKGYMHCGPVGSGHYVKMIHNGIEYGIMQAYAEGLDLLQSAGFHPEASGMKYDLDLTEITELWRRGSVIGSWLLDLTAMALLEDPRLEGYTGQVPDSGEGRWTVQTAVENAVSVPVLTAALFVRFRSRQNATFADRSLSAMREKFGGHREK
jgi:6-phosphogluconate dehydrogenase